MTSCLFVANNPGSVQVAFPVARTLHARGVRTKMYLTGHGVDLCEASGVSFEILDSSYSLAKIADLLEQEQPGVLVAGSSVRTSYLGSIENDFREVAARRGIFSTSILDCWTSYRDRFSADEGGLLDRLPDLIFAMDDHAREGMISCGIPQERIVTVGSVYLDSLADISVNLNRIEPALLKAELSLPPEAKVVTFISEPLSVDYPDSAAPYDEFAVVFDLIKLKEASGDLGTAFHLCLKPHPREVACKFDRFASECLVAPEMDKFRLLRASDLVVGMTSMLLVEAYLLNVPTISYQPGLPTQAQWPHPIPMCRIFSDLSRYTYEYLSGRLELSSEPNSIALTRTGATEAIADFLERQIRFSREDL
jgi:hypothetical protein